LNSTCAPRKSGPSEWFHQPGETIFIYRLRHSLAHIMAQAVLEIRPGTAKMAFGPPVEFGFYYDFDFGGSPLGERDLRRHREPDAQDHQGEAALRAVAS
jgi:hypothetical protein